ncbi:histone deacetylase family protein [Synoicihabitans lomoniglobus]|uniref:Histone deacetylase n=1 Tax=Synoicihabitans lomoniglobus TaxID=2909285 RepID=A0AAE9ZWJ7_9BACT|nr:histone deacetylase [Opitutaceae bacterium LMO-M01]WED64509.1 histone deacetylase [Opitutaceae bacterium LMO-M01]
MLLFHDPRCIEYGDSRRPEQPARLRQTVPYLEQHHPEWTWTVPSAATRADVLRVHPPAHLSRLETPEDFDADTPFFPGIAAHAYRASGAAIAAADAAIAGRGPAIALNRPPGHHATADQAMGFCYLNHIAIAALHTRDHRDLARVAVWDFDAHHGNGTEAIFANEPGLLFASVHQSPCYPGTGLTSLANCHNWPVPPGAPVAAHMQALRASLDRVIAFRPDLVLVSAGFDAYAGDPITDMTLETTHFATLGTWLRELEIPAAAVLEGGYSSDLPQLVDAFLTAWDGKGTAA